MYKIKAICSCCGFIDFYQIPKGRKFFPYKEAAGEFDEPDFSRHNNEDDDGLAITVDCHNCNLPELEAIAWDKDDSKFPVRQDITRLDPLVKERGDTL